MLELVKNASQSKSDLLGGLTSSLCLVHCLLTPFLFVAQAGISGHHHHAKGPWWWGGIDVLFLVLSLAAVYWSVQKTSKQWLKYAFVVSWLALSLVIFNEKIEGFHLPEEVIYLPTLGLIFLHLYNRKYCQCTDERCCANPPD